MIILILGMLLTGASWVIAWSPISLFSEYSFFPLWLGYILTVNGLSETLYSDSIMKRMRFNFPTLFAASIPFWWFFELINQIVQNWEYVFPHPISETRFIVQASISFSTVLPAVLSTIFLVYRLLSRLDYPWRCRPIGGRQRWLALSVSSGVICLFLLGLVPKVTFALVWIAPILIMEPVVFALRCSSLLGKIKNGDWLLPVSVMTATVVCGFFWEMWNVHSSPKWIYTVPYVGFLKIFEMPLLGYFGYPFFGVVVYSYTTFIFCGLLRRYSVNELICTTRPQLP